MHVLSTFLTIPFFALFVAAQIDLSLYPHLGAIEARGASETTVLPSVTQSRLRRRTQRQDEESKTWMRILSTDPDVRRQLRAEYYWRARHAKQMQVAALTRGRGAARAEGQLPDQGVSGKSKVLQEAGAGAGAGATKALPRERKTSLQLEGERERIRVSPRRTKSV